MRIEPANADPDAIPHGNKYVQVRVTKWGVVVQRRPRKGTRRWTKREKQWQQRFAFAARMASNPISLDLRTAIEMSLGTEQVPRDILTQAALGAYYIVQNKDGTYWRRVSEPAIQTGSAFRPPALALGPTDHPDATTYLTDQDGGRILLREQP